MKKAILFGYISISILFLLSSCCSIDKRVYRNGYHVEWNHKKKEVKENPAADLSESVAQQDEKTTPANADETEIIEKESAPAAAAAEEKPAIAVEKKGFLSKIIPEDTPEEEARIISGSKATAFKSGFKKGIKLMMPVQDGSMSRMAVASFILGILSLFAYYGAFVLGVLAIIFGAIAIGKIRRSGGALRGNTFAWIGLICGIISIALAFVIIRVI